MLFVHDFIHPVEFAGMTCSNRGVVRGKFAFPRTPDNWQAPGNVKLKDCSASLYKSPNNPPRTACGKAKVAIGAVYEHTMQITVRTRSQA